MALARAVQESWCCSQSDLIGSPSTTL
jgi:hypothetical protein